jgi:hypothetical protein
VKRSRTPRRQKGKSKPKAKEVTMALRKNEKESNVR